jgi:hypothetical protein
MIMSSKLLFDSLAVGRAVRNRDGIGVLWKRAIVSPL